MSIYAPKYTNEEAAREHLESVRWPQGPFCPHCGSFNAKRLPPVRRKATAKHPASVRKGVVQCRDCREQYTVTVGTVFERSKVPLFKWLLVNHLMVSSKKGISAHQIHRMIGVTYKTAWFMCHRIRAAMDQKDGPLGGSPEKIVEADEAFVGGKQSKQAWRMVAPKKIIFTLVERGGHARSFHVANVHANTLRPLLFQHADRLSSLMTDESHSYKTTGRHYWQHQTVNHGATEYARTEKGQRWHTNTVENFFSIFKRGIVGIYHHVSEAHFGRYAAEFDFRYNHRDVTDAERADQSLLGIFGKRLTYRRPHAIAA
jgi:transposase-like protein